MIQIIKRPEKSTIQPLSVTGVTSSYIYSGSFPLIFKMGSSYRYNTGEVTIALEDAKGQTDITDMFEWNMNKAILILKKAEYENFISLLQNKQRRFIISFADPADERHYMFSVIIGTGAADISGTITDIRNKLQSGRAMIIGRTSKNGFEFRQLSSIKDNNAFLFSNIPAGLYDLVVFDIATNQYGKREIMVDRQLSDIYIEIPVKKLK